MGQLIRVGFAGRFAFVTEGQTLVTSGLEAVIAATGQVLLPVSWQFAQGFLQLVALVAREG